MYQEEFQSYLKEKKNMSKNTLDAYQSDVMDFLLFAKEQGALEVTDISNTDIVSYLMKLKGDNKSAATVNRKLASIRAYFNYLMERRKITENPATGIKSPRIQRKDLLYLTLEEVDRLMAIPDDSTRGIRDRAILELLYATGIRVNEIIEANVEDVNLRIGFFSCPGEHGKARIVPMGRPARKAVEEYIFDARDLLVREQKDETALFVNYFGKRMTRQGLWKILKEYARKAEIENKLSPHILRNSFAVHMIQNGADLKTIKDLLGHEDIAATQIYLTVTKNRIKDVYDKTHPRA